MALMTAHTRNPYLHHRGLLETPEPGSSRMSERARTEQKRHKWPLQVCTEWATKS